MDLDTLSLDFNNTGNHYLECGHPEPESRGPDLYCIRAEVSTQYAHQAEYIQTYIKSPKNTEQIRGDAAALLLCGCLCGCLVVGGGATAEAQSGPVNADTDGQYQHTARKADILDTDMGPLEDQRADGQGFFRCRLGCGGRINGKPLAHGIVPGPVIGPESIGPERDDDFTDLEQIGCIDRISVF